MNRSEIRDNMRLLLNEREPGFWSDDDLNKCIVLACNNIYSIISNVKADYFTQSATFQTISGTKSYSFPTDCRFIRRMEIIDLSDPNRIYKVDEMKFPRTEASGPWPFVYSGRPSGYIVRGTQFDLYPIPDGNYDMRIYYDVRNADMASDSDQPSVPLDFQDMIVFWGCVLAEMINSENPAEFASMFNVRKEELISTLLRRGSDDPKPVEGYLEGIL